MEIRITENAAAKYASIDSAPLIKELNRKNCAAVNKEACQEAKKQDEKIMEFWTVELEASETGASTEASSERRERPFTLPYRFIWGVDFLLDQLMIV